jgi:5-methylcytosine-specific restriction enzyme A
VNWAEVRKIILTRDEGLCLRCGLEATDVHHRKVKGMGGTKDEKVAYGYANLISVCRYCHNWIHANPSIAYKYGFLVHSWDSERIMIVTKFGTLKLEEDGTRSVVKGPCDLF